jgi:hypothetical protein
MAYMNDKTGIRTRRGTNDTNDDLWRALKSPRPAQRNVRAPTGGKKVHREKARAKHHWMSRHTADEEKAHYKL